MKKIIVPLFVICIGITLSGWMKESNLPEDTLEKVTIQEFKGDNAVFITKKDIDEIAKLLKGEFMISSDVQDIKVVPDLYIIEEYKDSGTLTFGLSKDSLYIKCDIEGDIYWYKVTKEKRDEVYHKIKEKLYIEANK